MRENGMFVFRVDESTRYKGEKWAQKSHFQNSQSNLKQRSNEVVDISSNEEVNVNAHTEAGGVDVYSEDDEEYNPCENGGLYSEETEYGAHFKDSTDLNFSDDNDDGATNNSSNDSNDDCLSDAASFRATLLAYWARRNQKRYFHVRQAKKRVRCSVEAVAKGN
ncbi:hypothetical protein Q3G72_002006 [Acer saccharum]|nr:hypothetical protein Q3G72_002006 [Acer saccharum]